MEIILNDIVKSYKNIRAVNHISLGIKKGHVFGIIGPNGAGKTTLIEIMLGLRRQDCGEVLIHGMDSITNHKKLVYLIGAQLQESELPANIKVKEAIAFQAALFRVKPDISRLLSEFNLSDKANAYCSKLSGGQRQRLFILLAVIHNPEIVFFDELSTGLDPVSRQEVWNYVKKLKLQGKTIIVSTHYMQEAEEICDEVMLVNKGEIVDIGTSKELTCKLPFDKVLDFASSDDKSHIEKEFKKMKGFINLEALSENRYRVYIDKTFSMDDLLRNKRLDTDSLRSRESCFEDYFYFKVKIKG